MKNIKRFFALLLVFGMIASLVACDMGSLMSELLEDPDAQNDNEEALENNTVTEDEEDEGDAEDETKKESSTNKKWPWFGGKEEDSTTRVEIATNIEWDSSVEYPAIEEWPDEATGELEYTLEYNEYGEEYYVLSNIGSWRGKYLYVPSEYNGIPVKKIGYGAFMDARGLVDVRIEEGIEEIEMWAFGYCEALENISLPSTLTYISERVFTYSNNIVNVYSENGRYYAVNGCIIDKDTDTLHTVTNNAVWALQDVLENYGIRAIGNDACRGLTNLDYVKIPDNIEEIGAYAFYGCGNLTHLDIGNTENSKLSYISTSAFSYCPNINEIYIVDGNPYYYAVNNCLIQRIENKLVLGCQNSKIPDDGSVTVIGAFAFEGNTNLKKIVIPASVKIIETAAFEGCSNLRSVKLYEGLETIEQRAFCHDNALENIEIPSTVTFIGDEAFRGVPALDEDYTEPEYNDGTVITPDDSFGYGDVIIGEGEGGSMGGFSSVTINPDGSYTITYPDGTTTTVIPDENGDGSGGSFGNLSGSFGDLDLNGDFEFSTVVGGSSGGITYQPNP